jgi:DHA2 family multidrug resistance protein
MMTRAFIWDPPYLKRGTMRIDYWGIGLLALAIGALQVMLDKGQEDDWFSSHYILTLGVIFVAGFAAFIMRELMAEHPVVHLTVFRDRTYSAGVILMTCVGFVLYGSMVLLPIWLQTLLGYPALQAGIALAPRGMGSFIAMPIVGALLSRGDPRKFLATGCIIAGWTMWQFSRLNMDAGYWNFFWPQFIQGVSLGLLFVPLTTITMALIPREEMGNATSIFNFMRNIGGSFGIATVATLSARNQQKHMNYLSADVNMYNPLAQRSLQNFENMMRAHGSGPVVAQHQGYIMLSGMLQRQAAILSYLDVFFMLCMIFVSILPLILIMKRPPKGAARVAAH